MITQNFKGFQDQRHRRRESAATVVGKGLIDGVMDLTVADSPGSLGNRAPEVLRDRFGDKSGHNSHVCAS